MDAKVYGSDYQKCRFTDLPLETGHGALSVDAQAVANLGQASVSTRGADAAPQGPRQQAGIGVAKRNPCMPSI